ncbi:family 43 glycosylhydrolase [Reichenbachiella agariperforans]|uniref:family 43 glycosylhydrolase n=1 Tax=Reichenbachiella agariperforans TaxID=156994 RepID=UPI001C090659|nr:family 43 glycosylhydrolase [Reichenbachiella agariperforans]MBU2916244.1 family 43 glycosylhydrolase [Reichenbachiella agariperforans]
MFKYLKETVLGCLAILIFGSCQNEPKYDAYLFTYFVGNGPDEESIHYALSENGFNYYALNGNQPIVDSKDISVSGGVRDPHILRGEDGFFYMVVTDLYVPEMGWENTAMVLMKSADLINWTHTVIDIPQTYPENFGAVNRVWAPQTIYDQANGKYMICWSMRHNYDADIIYYAYANEDFTGLEAEPKQLLFKTGACIDGDIIYHQGKYHMFFKNEEEGAKGILKAVSDKINEGYVVGTEYMDQTDSPVEGSGVFPLIGTDKYILMYDMYTSGKYQFCESTDLENFRVIDENVSMNFHPRHGTVIPITAAEKRALINKWGGLDGAIQSATGEGVKAMNVVVDEENATIYLPIQDEVNAASFDPAFEVVPWVKMETTGPQDFSKGAVNYTFSLADGESKTYAVSLSVDHNPVLEGYYADPEIIYSEKEGKYYLYPTSDGFNGWSGSYFETFSSPDLVHWTNEGVIVDLKKDVSWTDRNAWAPTAIEKKQKDGSYKYYYYFTAAQRIGVAVSDSPSGPFEDSGQPLIDFKPEGVDGGQEIDPDVFADPVSGKTYLYWGNGYLAVVELNEDMVSVDRSTMQVMTPDETFREGAEVFYREGKYYFLWSEDDTRSPNYRVRYATADSPLGPLNFSKDNLVIQKDEANEIYATGHNSVIHVPGKDEWYIVYHRFNRPNGKKMGGAAGFHREVCIDAMEFDSEGKITQVTPTLKGIEPIK